MTRSSADGACVLMAAAAALLATGQAGAKIPTPTKVEDVSRVLKAKADATPKELSAAGSDPDAVLAELVGDTRADLELRVRAARALGGYPGQRARGVLTAAMTSRQYPEEIRVAAMTGLARAFKEVVLDELQPYVKDASPGLRAGAARALGVLGGARARALLLSAIESEEVIEVRAAMEEALKKL